jgi:hypothetical protein
VWFILPGVCAVLLLGLVAAADAEPPYVLSDSTTLTTPAPDRAMLVLVRESYARVRRMPADNLMLDGQPLGILPQHAFMVATVPAGEHCLSGVAESPDLRFAVEAGQSCLLRLRETVNGQDQLVADWLFDDANSVGALIRKEHLKRAVTTATGAAKLDRIARVRAGDCSRAGTVNATSVRDSAYDRVWYENPLDKVNLKSDFFSNPGTLRIGPEGLRYQAKGVDLVIPTASIRRVHFGGTRYTGTAPWVDIDWSGPDGQGVASFADSRGAQAVQTYNRLFRAAVDLMGNRTTSAEPESLYSTPNR